MKISRKRLRQIISEEVNLFNNLSESKVDTAASIFTRLNQLKSFTSVQGVPWIEAGLEAANLGWDEYRDHIAEARMGLTGLEAGLIGLAIGIPMLFFKEYSDGLKGDNIARYMAERFGHPVALKNIRDPRDSSTHGITARSGGNPESNPILYLASQPNLNIARELLEDDAVRYKSGPNSGKKGPAITQEVYGTILDIYRNATVARKKLKQILADKSVYDKIDKAIRFIT